MADLRSDHVLGAASLGSGLPLLHVVEACASSGTGWSPSSSCLFSSHPQDVDQHHHCPCSCFYQLGYPQHSSSSSKPFLIFSIGSNYYTLIQSVCHHFSLLWVLLSLNPSQESHHTTATKDEDKDKDKDKKEMFWERQSPPAHSGWGPLLVELERSNKTVLWDRLVLLPFFPFQIHLNIEQIIPKELEREFGVLYKRTIWMFHDMELQKVYL